MPITNNWKTADFDLVTFSAWDGATADTSATDFSITITPGAGTTVSSATINFGESADTDESLTAASNVFSITGQTYSAAGTYLVTIKATLADGTVQTHYEQCVVS